MTDPIVNGLKIVIAICVLTAIYCCWELWQDWKTDQMLRKGFKELDRQERLANRAKIHKGYTERMEI